MNAAPTKRRRHRDGRTVLTEEDQHIFQRASERHERNYRAADGEDAEIVRLRLMHGGIVANVKAGIS